MRKTTAQIIADAISNLTVDNVVDIPPELRPQKSFLIYQVVYADAYFPDQLVIEINGFEKGFTIRLRSQSGYRYWEKQFTYKEYAR